MNNNTPQKPQKPQKPQIPQMPQMPQKPQRLLALLAAVLLPLTAAAQINIGGNVFGGARQADVKGHTFVDIGAQYHDVIINGVYGGNDIAGTIGTSSTTPFTPVENIDNSYNSYVRTNEEAEGKHLFIGMLYGGGNGDYIYTKTGELSETGDTLYNVTTTKQVWDETLNGGTGGNKDVTVTLATSVVKPELAKAYIELNGGTFGYAYGGGNNATVTRATDICINNSSTVTKIAGEDGQGNPTGLAALTHDRLIAMKINTEYYTNEYNFARVFGGNNKADMKIRPTWHLLKGSIKHLYSGGNEGRMTNEEGLLLEIQEGSDITVENVYGGCRKADVRPLNARGWDAAETAIQLSEKDEQNRLKYKFPAGLAARTLVRGGTITNVYGGNDVKGRVYGGNAVGIYHSISGNVYGGGNGSYAYTDNDALKDDLKWGDFYYDPSIANSSVEALNLTRPNAEQVSLRIAGQANGDGSMKKQVIIGGSVYVGGNSATLSTTKANPMVELKIGSYVYADNVFLGNNGENMVSEDILQKMAPDDVKTANNIKVTDQNDTPITGYSSIDLTNGDTFATYMQGCAMDLIPSVVFDSEEARGDPATYIPYTTWIGSLFLGGNVGSMTYAGTNTADLSVPIYIYNKVVGGCNNANVNASAYNARYEGGIMGSDGTGGTTDERDGKYTDNGLATGNIKDRLVMNFGGVEIQPMRWNDNKSELVWNTVYWHKADNDHPLPYYVNCSTTNGVADNKDRRLNGGNVYGGCYNSGHVNGNVVINVTSDLVVKNEVFAVTDDSGTITTRNSGVICEEQSYDVLGTACNVFGGGYGMDSEVWGSVTVNLKKGYVFQVFGGGEMGYIGKGTVPSSAPVAPVTKTYTYDSRYSTTINLHGTVGGTADGTGLAEAENIYGGGLEGDVCGDTQVNLGNGRVYDVLAGACNANVLGHTSLYIGGNGEYETVSEGGVGYKKYKPYGFPYVRNNVYGGNDFGGTIKGDGNADYHEFVKPSRLEKIQRLNDEEPSAFLSSYTYVAYLQGRVDSIFGGNYGHYEYANRKYSKYTDNSGKPRIADTDELIKDLPNIKQFYKPHFDNAFVNFQPVENKLNDVSIIFGGSQGNPGEKTNNNSMQEKSYIHIDDTETTDRTRFAQTDIYGGGAFGGMGTQDDPASGTEGTPGAGMAIIDLFTGRFHNVYGGSNQEGLIGYTRVNVPDISTIQVNAIYGGGQGYDPTADNYGGLKDRFCDNYVTAIDYQSANAHVEEALYGGNQNCRIAADTYLNVTVPVTNREGKLIDVYGAGYGPQTVSARTNVFLQDGAQVARVYGGGRDGKVYNFASLEKWLATMYTSAEAAAGVAEYGGYLKGFSKYLTDNNLTIKLPEGTGSYRNETSGQYDGTHKDDIQPSNLGYPTYHNTNVRIMEGAMVKANPGDPNTGYAYGGGLGAEAIVGGTTYIELLGGEVEKDLSGGGWGGDVKDQYEIGAYAANNLKGFTAGTNVVINGGTLRNVFGGGYQGNVGMTDMFDADGKIASSVTLDNKKFKPDLTIKKADPSSYTEFLGETNVTIGNLSSTTFTDGIPAIQRSVYGGGERGAIYGTTHVTMNNGYIGYKHNGTTWVENVDQDTAGDELLDQSGNIFGGGYEEGGNVDITNVTMYGGTVRNSIFGGGEIAAVGRGKVDESGEAGSVRKLEAFYKAGQTHVYMYHGNVLRNVFGGGRGYNTWNSQTSERYTDGYVFGSTDVHIRGGIIGTAAGMLAKGYGNVFGGGDIGYVYSDGYELGSHPEVLSPTNGLPQDGGGYYYTHDDITAEGNSMTIDTNVDVEVYCLVTGNNSVTIDGTTYNTGDYVPVEKLNHLKRRTSADQSIWEQLDVTGIKIHNAVFAGGNISSGSDRLFANATTVFGNATAALRDVYNRDLISIGTEHTGGLYGDGNLSFVDGFRELHIDNYGTDFYGLSNDINVEVYNSLTENERAYYVLNYKCVKACTDKNGHNYNIGDRLTGDEFREVFTIVGTETPGTNETTAAVGPDGKPNSEYWAEAGFYSRYAGRILNTIQRAEMCAVYGSRMVLNGARDRVTSKADYTNYTINRVGEVSLNQRDTQAGDTGDDAKHGNYFGIYNVVNYLGNLTSDVFFAPSTEGAPNSVRQTNVNEEGHGPAVDGKTYYEWKAADPTSKNRNNGISHNKVALASGVHLDIIREETELRTDTVWGYITGVVELDLIDVMTGEGGGYVYAKNEHRQKTWHGKADDPNRWSKVNLSPYNNSARTFRRYTYSGTEEVFETSGNFVHNTKTIIDDCYPTSNAYKGANAAPAHFWYIKGQIYVYDQYISAYTGSANAYAKDIDMPFTISASSHGKLTLRDVKLNKYAYKGETGDPLSPEQTIEINNVLYHAGDAIDYWTWSKLGIVAQSKFVDNLYVVVKDCTVKKTDGTTVEYKEGEVMLPADFNTLSGEVSEVSYVDGKVTKTDKELSYFVREANNLSHGTGYVLTCEFNNPGVWNDYYTNTTEASDPSVSTEIYNAKNGDTYTLTDRANYLAGPTYSPTGTDNSVYGQRTYQVSEIIDGETVSRYPASLSGTAGQATVKRAYLVTQQIDEADRHFYVGARVSEADFPSNWSSVQSSVAPAYIWTSTYDVSETEHIYANTLYTADGIAALKSTYGLTDDIINQYKSDAYICTKEGLYGGTTYSNSKAYRAVEAWCSMSAADRANFKFNYDALDLLIDPSFGTDYQNGQGGNYGYKPQYDGLGTLTNGTQVDNSHTKTLYSDEANKNQVYSLTHPIDYEAVYLSTNTADLEYTPKTGPKVTITRGQTITRRQFEKIPNEKVHWAPLTVGAAGNYYIVKEPFLRGEFPYTAGQVISENEYLNQLDDTQRNNVDQIVIDNNHAGQVEGDVQKTKTYYYCREAYTIGEKGEGQPISTLGIKTGTTATNYAINQEVPAGVLISSDTYNHLVNKQLTSAGTEGFVIRGTAPKEVSTLYVSRESDINDVSKEKIITVIFLYEYEESDASGNNITPVSERHILNIHLQFKTGVPELGELKKPKVVLPGSTVGLRVPDILTEGAFEISGSGWELYTNSTDADLHTNGQPYYNNQTQLYWYQDNYWVAYYADTYLGRTYSNAVPFTVANYHDLKKVMDDTKHHYYIDHEDVDRAPKIYINDYSGSGGNGLQMFRDLFTLSTGVGTVTGHSTLNTTTVGNCKNLEFFLRTNLTAPDGEWAPIGDDTHCFEGTLHGDGYFISGIDHSLFNNLCGDVYNLGVTGPFPSAGISENGTGFLENCWIKSTATSGFPAGTKPVFQNPTNATPAEGETARTIHMVNCYYPVENGYTDHPSDATYGLPKAMPLKAFYNGTVTYDLNEFYLFKRYCDNTSSVTGNDYSYWTVNTTDPTKLNMQTGHYLDVTQGTGAPLGPYLYESGGSYVEDRFADGDFIYAGGYIPSTDDIRLYVNPSNAEDRHYYPIWPDDYLFFGQTLTYGHVDSRPHQEVPSNINRANGRLLTTDDANRVYRAPAYFRNRLMDVAHFNPYAVFSQTKKNDPTVIAYKNMTAIDFTGYNDATYSRSWTVPSGSPARFYPPLLDDDGLTGFRNVDLTQNLLAYTGTVSSGSAAEKKTATVVSTYLNEPPYEETHATYRTVAQADPTGIHGHWVALSGSPAKYTTDRDHLLVDCQDFNAPIAYQMGSGKRMWYQRTPDRYVDTKQGWEAISLPFQAELVTTNDKGEITHFYEGSNTADGSTDGAKIGHEYWLRQYEDISTLSGSTAENNIGEALFNYPKNGTVDDKKKVTNTFLWDYYYNATSGHNHLDKNTDTYQTYYSTERTYEKYGYLQNGTPYLIGFPGSRYYEFDLSGSFEAQTTASPNPTKLDPQVITFASPEAFSVDVSDNEMDGDIYNGYTFRPSYLNEELTETGSYYMNDDGDAYTALTSSSDEPVTVAAFRPFFVKAPSSAPAYSYIVFSNDATSLQDKDIVPDPGEDVSDHLFISTKRGKIVVTSALYNDAEVQIYSAGGSLVETYTIKPGETQETNIYSQGVYIVRAANGRFTKKLSVK